MIDRDVMKILRDMAVTIGDGPDGTVIVKGDINLSGRNLTQLPDFSNVILYGNFNCEKNKLSSLIGAPHQVSGDFICFQNNLTTLQGAPRAVGGTFNCRYNFLETLDGGPDKVGQMLACENNHLVSLSGCASEIGMALSCAGNPDLEKLSHLTDGDYPVFSDLGNFETPRNIPMMLRMTRDDLTKAAQKASVAQEDIAAPRPVIKKTPPNHGF